MREGGAAAALKHELLLGIPVDTLSKALFGVVVRVDDPVAVHRRRVGLFFALLGQLTFAHGSLLRVRVFVHRTLHRVPDHC